MNTKNIKNQPENKQPSSNNGKVLQPADYEKLRVTVTKLNPQDEAHWNKSGGPNMNYINEAMGMVITADHMKTAGVDGWNREVSQKLADDLVDREVVKKKIDEKVGGENGGGEGNAKTVPGPVEIGGEDHQKIMEEFPAPETPLEREERERQEARSMSLENDQGKANKHDESAAKIRAQVAAQKKADIKHEKNLAAKKKQQEADDEIAVTERQERVALEPSVHGLVDMDKGPGPDDVNPMIRIDRLERAVLTLSKILLDTPMTPVQRGKLANCVALLDPSSDED